MTMKVWFLNVGHGDCTIIEHPSGRITMIDINNSQNYDPDSHRELAEERQQTQMITEALSFLTPRNALLNAPAATSVLSELIRRAEADRAAEQAERNELTDPIKFFKDTFPGRSLFRFVLTHPDMDHMRGIKKLFQEIEVVNFWDTANSKSITSFNSTADKEDWEFYQNLRAGKVGIATKNYLRGADKYAFSRDEDGSLGGDGISILSPTNEIVTECNRTGKFNDLSLVLDITYGGRNFIFAGDAEQMAWDSMVAAYGASLKADVLKASHHGRDSGFHTKALQAIQPTITVVSVGRKPSTDAHQKYHYHSGVRVRSTRRHGLINVVVSPDGSWNWYVERNPD